VQRHHVGVGQLAELFFVDGEEAVDRELAAVGQGGVEAHVAQQAQLHQQRAGRRVRSTSPSKLLELLLHRSA
jgi:hypothetical protein